MKQWTGDAWRSWDVVVIGSGAAGLTAALTAAERGLSVAVFEKSELFGGTSAVSAGTIWLPNFAADEADEAVEYLSAQRGDGASDEKIRAIVENSAPMIRLVMEKTGLGVTPVAGFPDYHQDLAGASAGRSAHPDLYDTSGLGELREALRTDGLLPYTQGELKSLGYGWAEFPRQQFEERRDRGIVARGAALVGALLSGCRDLGVALFTEAELTGLEKSEDDTWRLTVSGADTVARRAVVLASGGFEWDASLRKKHLGNLMEATCSPQALNTGEGLKLAQRLGAGTAELDQAWWAPLLTTEDTHDDLVPGTFFRIERMGPGSITVDATGKRFANESLDYNTFIREAIAAHDGAPNDRFVMYIVFDHRFLTRFGFIGRSVDDELQGVTTADSVESLAQKLGIDGSGLVEAVRDFNEAALVGVDGEFGRGVSSYDRYYGDDANPFPNPCLAPLATGPFYAARLRVGAFGTSGGITTDATGAVIGQTGSVILGLYAVGNVSCQPFASGYPGAGATLGPGMTMGYLAGMEC